MRERGRAIPATPTIPIVERKSSPSNPPPRIVEGRVSMMDIAIKQKNICKDYELAFKSLIFFTFNFIRFLI